MSITLILSNFDFNKNSIKDKLYVENFAITNEELNSLLLLIKNKYPSLYDIKNIDDYLKNFISNDLLFNIKFNKFKLFVESNAIKDIITNDKLFLKDKKFSLDLYKKYLAYHNISDIDFQNIILNRILLNKFKNDTQFLLSNSYGNEFLKVNYKIISSSNISNIKLDDIYNNIYNEERLKFSTVKFLNFSIKNVKNLLFINSLLIRRIYDLNSYIYLRKNHFKFNFVKINKKIKNYNTIKFILNNSNIFNKLILNNTLEKINGSFISKKELNNKIIYFIERYKSNHISLETFKYLYIFNFYKSFNFINFNCFLIDLNNKIKKKYSKMLFLNILNTVIIKFDNISKFNISGEILNTSAYFTNKQSKYFNSSLTVNKVFRIYGIYNYVISSYINYNEHLAKSYLNEDINDYFAQIKCDKYILNQNLFNGNKINLNFKIYNDLLFKYVSFHKIFYFKNKYLFFDVDRVLYRSDFNYKKIKQHLLVSN